MWLQEGKAWNKYGLGRQDARPRWYGGKYYRDYHQEHLVCRGFVFHNQHFLAHFQSHTSSTYWLGPGWRLVIPVQIVFFCFFLHFLGQKSLKISFANSWLKGIKLGSLAAAANQQSPLTVAPASAATVWPKTFALCPAHVKKLSMRLNLQPRAFSFFIAVESGLWNRRADGRRKDFFLIPSHWTECP